jgi:hypothetical protein
VLTGALAAGIIGVGEGQADLVAGGLAGLSGTSAVVVVAPAGATGVAIATAVVVAAIGIAAGVLLVRVSASVFERRVFWGGVLGVVAAILTLGAVTAGVDLEPVPHPAPIALLAAVAHSTLLAFVGVGAILRLITVRRRQPDGGRLVG